MRRGATASGGPIELGARAAYVGSGARHRRRRCRAATGRSCSSLRASGCARARRAGSPSAAWTSCAARVRIDRQLVTPAGGGPADIFGPTKTASSNRVLTLPESVGEVLAAHLARFGRGRDGLIFTSRTGRRCGGRRGRTPSVRRCERSGLTASTHDLRHHCASMLIPAGCSVTAVQHFLGHKNASRDARHVRASVAERRGPDPRRDRRRAPVRCARDVHGECCGHLMQCEHHACSDGWSDGESACKRDSVVASRRPVAIHLCGLPGGCPHLSVRTDGPPMPPARPCSGWGLPSRPGRPGRWCALTAPFHPCL